MYIHIGSNVAVSDAQIVGIFDIDGATADGQATREFLNAGNIKEITDDLPKCFVVCDDITYICGVNVGTIAGRVF